MFKNKIIEEAGGYWHVAFVIDSFTKMTIADALPNNRAPEIALFIWEKVYCFALAPGVIVHDRDPSLNAEIMKALQYCT